MLLLNEDQQHNKCIHFFYHFAIEQNFDNVKEIFLTWHFLRYGSKVSIFQSKEQLKKIETKIHKQIKNILEAKNNTNIFLPKESMICNWCYYWEECSAKIGSNLAKRAI